MKKAIVLFSGGKDSVFATWFAAHQGFKLHLLTVESAEDSMMFHYPNVRWTKLQAKSMGISHSIVKTSSEMELMDVEKAISKLDGQAIFAGAIASDYQRQRIEQIGEKLGIPTYFPLWHKEKMLMEVFSSFEIYIVGVSAEGLGAELLGKPFFEIAKIKNIHPFLEGGEGETFVANAPFFHKRIIIDKWNISWDGVRGVAKIEKAHLG